MRLTTTTAAAAVAGVLAATTLGLTGSAVAAPAGHYSAARADWKGGAKADAAEQGKYWSNARDELGAGHTYERHDLAALSAIPLTGTTAKQRATAKRLTRQLNGFFRTPGLYGVGAGKPKQIAKADWLKSAKVAAADQNIWLAAANDELDSFGQRYHHEQAALTSLESIPLTNTTAKQRAKAHHDVHVLDKFFGTPGVGA